MPPKEKIHWTYQGKVIDSIEKTPKGSFAFIYKITLEDGSWYVGKKYLFKPNYTSGAKKGQSKGMYPWQSYVSSSKEVKALIKSGMKYKKEILYFTFSRAETTYMETREILCSGALTDSNCRNYWVKATIYSKHLTNS